MGIALVATMVKTGDEGSSNKKVHPFFTRAPDAASESSHVPQDEPQEAAAAQEAEGRAGKKRGGNDASPTEDGLTPEPKKQKRKRKSGRSSLNENITNHLTKPHDAESTPAQVAHEHIPTPPLSDASAKTFEQLPHSEEYQFATTATLQVDPMVVPKSSPQNKKVLKFNPKTGTLGSPPKLKKTSPPSKVVTLKYGNNDAEREEIGLKITAILEAPVVAHITPTKRRRGRPRKSQVQYSVDVPSDPVALEPMKIEGTSTSKETHPFFTGKANVPQETERPVEAPKPSPPKRHTISMATPVSPRKPRGPPPKAAHFGSLNNPGLLRIPGAKYAPWPAQGMAHVRGNEEALRPAPIIEANVLHSRKFKGQTVGISAEDSAIGLLVRRLGLQTIRDSRAANEDKVDPPSEKLRLPARQFESGRKLQSRVRPHLHTLRRAQIVEDAELDPLANEKLSQAHPIVSRLYKDLETRLSAYDRSTCENVAWCQKYAPSTATEIVQAGKEATYLKDWLEALRVQSVDTGANDSSKEKTKSEKAPKKRRKKLDDFIVDSDEEAYELDEVFEEEPDWTPAGSGQLPKTVLRPNRRDGGRMNNAVVISGPHGCGKTATVYAVAKEIGYEVFEINSSSKRSGKDLLDKIGDMTKNHLVQQHQADGAEDEDAVNTTEQDIASGKQGTMTSFFQAKPAAGPKKMKPKQKLASETKAPAKSQKAQKQSLIFLEEVDILYEEDKQFWATLMTMIAQSRRPFIMTCNDESLIPLQSLALHGIFRFAPPPTELAVDVSLLIAANEGHALERQAVESLYVSRGHDLRATIAELNYWCQIGVGDRRGGFDWFFLRWPRGIDLDENKDTVRVISENTYLKGMGWLAHDLMATSDDYREIEEDAIYQSWDSWQVAMGDWHDHLDMRSCTRQMSKSTSFGDINAYDAFCETLSDGDIFSNSTYALALQEIIDPGLPDLPTKMREDFSIGRQLLEADPIAPQVSLECDITTSLSSSARQCLMNHAEATEQPAAAGLVSPVDEAKAISILEASFQKSEFRLTRMDLAHAFDPIAVSNSSPSTHLEPSVFDRTLNLIVLDVAPWVRSIVAFDEKLANERKKLSNLLSEGGKRKRSRNTRAAYSALEGGERKSTRREKYFQGTVNSQLVMKTGLQAWQDAAKEETKEVEVSVATTPEAMDQGSE